MQFSKEIAGILAAITLVPLMVPSADASCVCKKKVYRTSHRVHLRSRTISKTRTVYRTSYIPMTRTVYRTQYVPMRETIFSSNIVPVPAVTQRVIVPQVIVPQLNNTRTIVTRTTRSEQFIPIIQMPAQTVVRTTSIIPTTTTRVITTTPDLLDLDTRRVIINDGRDRIRLGSRDRVIWY